MSLAGELLRKYELEIESLALVPSDGGVFEISVNSSLVFSKKQSGRHAEPGEVAHLFENFIQ